MMVYGPSGVKTDTKKPREQLYTDIHKWTNSQKDYMAATEKWILMGDFNATIQGNKPKDQQLTTLIHTASMHPLNNLTNGTTYYGSGANTLIDYIIGNNIARDTHLETHTSKTTEIQTDHKLLRVTLQTATTLRNSAKQCTRNTDIRNTKLYRTRDKDIWQRAFTDILQQHKAATSPPQCNWQSYIQTAGEKFMSKGKAKNDLQETTFADIGKTQKTRATLDRLTKHSNKSAAPNSTHNNKPHQDSPS